MIRLTFLAAGLLLASASPAWALPVAAVAAFIGVASTSIIATVATFLVNTAISVGLSYATGKIFGPKIPKNSAAAAQERQASVTSLQIGEAPREVIFGEAATGGSLAGAFNYGGEHGTDWVVKVIVLADHRCESLQGYYVGDTFVDHLADGAVGGYNGQLEVYWRDGQAGQTFPPALMSAWRASPRHALTAPTSDTPYQGQAYVVVAYKVDAPDSKTPTWSGSHPQFLFVPRGKRCYDPRRDDTVGGSGAHRWDDPATWEWTRNAAICRYNWVRGIYALDQVDDPAHLLVGRGLSTLEAPPARVFAYANLCDEYVDDGEGGTEPRYSIDGVIRATDDYLAVEQMFEAAMAGRIIQPDGGVEVEPGQAKTPVYSFTDDDLVVGRPVKFNAFGSDAQRVNTVIPRYIEPSQKWQDHAGPVRRDLADLALDGGPREETLPLSLVTSSGQAQRVAEIRRKAARLERTAQVTLPPRFSEAEPGDWVQWTSARHTGGDPVVFRIVNHAQDAGWENTWALEEVSFDVYGFGGAPLPVGPGQAPVPPPDALTLSGVAITAIEIEGDTGALVPALRFAWDTPVDAGVTRIRAEVRMLGQTQVAPTTTEEVNAGELVATNGVAPGAQMQGRLVPLGAPGRPIAPTDWVTVTTPGLVASEALGFPGVSLEAITDAVAAAEVLANALSTEALKRSQVVEALRRLSLTPTGLPIGPFAMDTRTLTDTVVTDVSLIGVRSVDGTAFDLSSTTLRIDGEVLAETLDVLYAATQDAFAQITAEATARVTGDTALASSINAVSATVGGHTATLFTHASALATLDGRTQASYEIVAAAGGNPAYAKFVATNTGSGIALAAQELALFNFIGGVLVRVLRLVDGKAFFSGPVSIDLGAARLTMGPGFGASGDLLFWFGNNSVAVESMTKTNGKWAFASDLKTYYGSGELNTAGGFRGSASHTYVEEHTASVPATLTTTNVTASAANAPGSVTYQWVCSNSDIEILAPTNATTALRTSALSVSKQAVIGIATCIMTSGGQQTYVSVGVNFYYDI